MAKTVLVAVDRDGEEPSFLRLFAVTAENIDAAVEAVQMTLCGGARARMAGHMLIQKPAGPITLHPGAILAL